MAETATAPKDSTILGTPPVVKPTSDQTLYDKTPAPKTPAAPPTTPPAAPPSGTPPAAATPPPAPTPPVVPQEPPKPGAPATPPEVPATPADYDLKLPEGSPLSPEDLAVTLKDAKTAGLTKEAAEGMLKTKDDTARQVLARQTVAFEAEKKAWKDATVKDPEIGGENYARNVEIASRAWDKVASPALKKMAEDTGIGNHPEVIRMMLRVGQMMAEDRIVLGSTGPLQGKKSKEDIMYGNPKGATEPLA